MILFSDEAGMEAVMKHIKILFFKSVTKNRLFFLYIIAYIPLLLCILIGSEYGKHLLKQQSIQYNYNTLSLQLATVDTSLEHISNYLSSILLNDENYNDLISGKYNLKEQMGILDSFTQYLGTYNNCSSLFFYVPEYDILILQSSNYDTYPERQEMRTYLREHCFARRTPAKTPKIHGWSFISLPDKSYLMEMMEYQNIYIGSFASGAYTFSELQTLTENTNGTLFLSNQAKKEALLYGNNIVDRESSVNISVDSSKNHYRILLCIPEEYVLGAFSWFHYVILALAVMVLVFLGITLFITWRQMVSPVIRMISAMKAVQKGDFDSCLPVPDTGDEFAELTETFNYMIVRIHDLKLQIYEEKLNHAYAELQYLTLQIKPHFFLNCLNLIYSLGLSGRSELVAEFSSTLMRYFRYLFKSSDSMVSLNQELEHVKNYLHIQQIRFQNELNTQFVIEENSGNMMIPVLTLQTFIENIFKHAYHDSSKMLLRITSKPVLKNKVPYLVLEIEDNGKGFSEKVLAKLNQKPSTVPSNNSEHHIGINNIKQRLQYIYNCDITLTFSNRPEGGASILLELPQNGQKGNYHEPASY